MLECETQTLITMMLQNSRHCEAVYHAQAAPDVTVAQLHSPHQ